MSKRTVLSVTVSILSIACATGAAETGDLASENAKLRQRVENLDNEVQQLKKAVMQQDRQSAAKQPMPVLSNLDIQLYGFLKLDAAHAEGFLQ